MEFRDSPSDCDCGEYWNWDKCGDGLFEDLLLKLFYRY